MMTLCHGSREEWGPRPSPRNQKKLMTRLAPSEFQSAPGR